MFGGTRQPTAPASVLTSAANIAAGKPLNIKWSGTGGVSGYKLEIIDKATGKVVQNQTKTFDVKTPDHNYNIILNTPGTYYARVYNTALSSSPKNSADFTVHAPVTAYYYDEDGTTLLGAKTVDWGSDIPKTEAVKVAKAEKEGHDFLGWDNISGIQDDYPENDSRYPRYKQVAKYAIQKFTVKFLDQNGTVLKTQQNVEWGTPATPPAPQNIPNGYVFAGWDKDYTNVKSAMTVNQVVRWANPNFSVAASIDEATYDQAHGFYNVKVTLNGNPEKLARGNIVVSLKTAAGAQPEKMVAVETRYVYTSQIQSGNTHTIQVPYNGIATKAEVEVLGLLEGAKSDSTGTIIAEKVSRDITLGMGVWSPWSPDRPGQNHTATEGGANGTTGYRVRERDKKESTSASMAGYAVGKTEVRYGNWSSWSNYGYDNLGANTATRETKKAWTYRYYHFTCSSCGANTPYWSLDSTYKCWNCWKLTVPRSTWYEYWSESNPATYGTWNFDSAKGVVKIWGNDFYYERSGQPSGWMYSNRTRTATTVYTLYTPWGEWSDWKTGAPPAASDTKDVQTAPLWRYYDEDARDSDDTGESLTASGALASAAGKKATVMVYKRLNTDALAKQLQYIGQTTLGASGEYAFTFRAREELSRRTGDFVVELAVEGADAPVWVETIYAPPSVFDVTFMDDEGNTLSEQKNVPLGHAAAPPEPPEKEGFTFAGWSCAFTNVQDDLTVLAQYEKTDLTVQYLGLDDEVIAEEQVPYGETPEYVIPAPSEDGKIFTGWPSYGAITEGTTLTPSYEIAVYTVIFLNTDGSLLDVQQVRHGEDATLPALNALKPAAPPYVLGGWPENIETFVISDMIVKPSVRFDRDAAMPTLSVSGASGAAAPSPFFGDGRVTAADRVYLSRHLASWPGYETIDTETADLNNDGQVTAADRVWLSRCLASWPGYTLN